MGESPKQPARSWSLVVVLLALFAYYFAREALARNRLSPEWAILGLILTMVFILTVGGWLLHAAVRKALQGVPCPHCLRGRMSRERVVSFGPRIFRCHLCERRWHHMPFAGWVDVTETFGIGPVKVPGPIPDEPWPDVADEPLGSKSIDSLVRNQRRRKDDP